MAPNAAPPSAQAKPPSATTHITARSGGPANHCPQQPLPDLSDGDLQMNRAKILKFYVNMKEFSFIILCLSISVTNIVMHNIIKLKIFLEL